LIVAAVLGAASAAACGSPQTPTPPPTGAPASHSASPSQARHSPSPKSKPPTDVHGYLRTDDYPTVGALGGDLSALQAGIEADLNVNNGWARAGFHFTLDRGPDNTVFQVVVLSNADITNRKVSGWCRGAPSGEQPGGCQRAGNGVDSRCVITLNWSRVTAAGGDPTKIAGIVNHEVGHCVLGPKHTATGLMTAFLPARSLAITARPSASQIKRVKARLAKRGATPFLRGSGDPTG
jgi:hypothetical protein